MYQVSFNGRTLVQGLAYAKALSLLRRVIRNLDLSIERKNWVGVRGEVVSERKPELLLVTRFNERGEIVDAKGIVPTETGELVAIIEASREVLAIGLVSFYEVTALDECGETYSLTVARV